MKKGFGGIKSFLFEQEEESGVNYNEDIASLPYNSYDYAEEIQEQREVNASINIENVLSVEEIYKASNLDDLSKSIYKVEEIKSVLPNTLPTAAKKESVLGMLKVSNITQEEILDDVDDRKNTLESVLLDFTKETTDIIEENLNEVAALEERINELKIEINARKLKQEQQGKIITDELSKIDSIVEFII